jgi:hypothetical protein
MDRELPLDDVECLLRRVVYVEAIAVTRRHDHLEERIGPGHVRTPKLDRRGSAG